MTAQIDQLSMNSRRQCCCHITFYQHICAARPSWSFVEATLAHPCCRLPRLSRRRQINIIALKRSMERRDMEAFFAELLLMEMNLSNTREYLHLPSFTTSASWSTAKTKAHTNVAAALSEDMSLPSILSWRNVASILAIREDPYIRPRLWAPSRAGCSEGENSGSWWWGY